MKSKLTMLLFTLFISVWSLTGSAQAALPNGKAQLIEFTNATANFTVPEGKTWYIYSIFSDYLTGGTIQYNEHTNEKELDGASEIRIFLKDLNGKEKTIFTKNIYGPQLFRSSDATTVIPYPFILPEKTTFNLLILKGDLGSPQMYGGVGYLNIIETDN